MSENLYWGEILDEFIENYNHAFCDEDIRKPKAAALYATWKLVDSIEKPRFGENDEIIDYNELILNKILEMKKEELTAIKTVKKMVVPRVGKRFKVSIIIEKREENE